MRIIVNIINNYFVYLHRDHNPKKSVIVLYYKRNIWTVHRTALISINELLGKCCYLLIKKRCINNVNLHINTQTVRSYRHV